MKYLHLNGLFIFCLYSVNLNIFRKLNEKIIFGIFFNIELTIHKTVTFPLASV